MPRRFLRGPAIRSTAYTCRLQTAPDRFGAHVYAPYVAPRVATEDLVDAQGVAEILGLAHRNTVSLYQRRYREMPRPVLDLGRGRPKLWLRSEVQRWAGKRPRPERPPSTQTSVRSDPSDKPKHPLNDG